jgi:hypothetical protein
MRTSAPFMSAFVIYVIGLLATVLAFHQKKRSIIQSKIMVAFVFIVIALFSFTDNKKEIQLTLVDRSTFIANQPVGEARGTIPGRVVWVYNPDATNENMTNTANDYWYLDKNCNQTVVDSMFEHGIIELAGAPTIAAAWDSLFRYFNKTHNKGDVGYKTGEKIAIKINLTNSASPNPQHMDASPQTALTILKQLIEVVKVAQKDIWLGDNYRTFRDEYYTKLHSVYPDVHYIDGTGLNGREKTVPSKDSVLKFSDHKIKSNLPQQYIDAPYLINMACLKSHNSAGITLTAKNHQGSFMQKGGTPENQSAFNMHYCLPDQNPKKDQYRHIVDYTGHKDLGGKTLLFIVDGLWAGKSWDGVIEKWKMQPFNNDYPSSVFFSQDPIAIDAVCFDFLLEEYSTKSSSEKYPYMQGADDYLKQAASSANWPAGITYDPEGDGIPIGSLGVYEHWNNATDKKYSRNLGTGKGIELKYYLDATTATNIPTSVEIETKPMFNVFPNPFTSMVKVNIYNNKNKQVKFQIFDIEGKLLYSNNSNSQFIWNGTNFSGGKVAPGIYILRATAIESNKILLQQKIQYILK